MKRKITALLFATILILLVACNQSKPNGNQYVPDSSQSDITQPETDDSNVQSSTSSSSEEEFLPLEIKDYGYALNKNYLFCAVVLHNPNISYCVEFPTFRITARDADGLLLGSEKQVLSIIYPQQDFCYAGQMFKVEEEPATVEVEVIPPDDYDITDIQLNDVYNPLVAYNTVMRDNRIMGEIMNINDYEIDKAIVTVFFKDEEGNILAGNSTFVDEVPAYGSIPFDMSVNKAFTTDNFEVYANFWH